MTKHDAVVLVLDEMPDASAADIAEVVADRFGIEVSGHYVRTVRSREGRSGTPVVPVQRSRSNHTRTARPRATRPAQLVPRPVFPTVTLPAPIRPEDDPELQADDAVSLAKIERVIAAVEKALDGYPQQVAASPEAIAEITEILDDKHLRADYPGFDYEVTDLDDGRERLVLYQAGNPPVIPVPAKNLVQNAYIPPELSRQSGPRMPRSDRRHSRGKPFAPKCDFCTDKPAVLSQNIYKVQGGALGPRARYLCAMHAQAEAAAGATVTPYLPYGGQVDGVGIVRQPETPYMQNLKELARSVGDVIFGYQSEY